MMNFKSRSILAFLAMSALATPSPLDADKIDNKYRQIVVPVYSNGAVDKSASRRESRQSRCYPFQDPDCCVNVAVCQCANGSFYEFNQDNKNASNNGCDPPLGVLGTDEGDVPGFCCD